MKENPALKEYTKRDHCVEEEDGTEQQDESSLSTTSMFPADGDYNYDDPFPFY